MKYFESIIAISDLQAPFEHPDAFAFLRKVKQAFYISKRKTLIINQGDEADFHASAPGYEPDQDGMSPGQELNAAISHLKPLWDLFPEQYICTSNHMMRPFKAAKGARLSKQMLKSMGDMLQAPKDCKWADRWIFNKICFEHGEFVSGTDAALKAAIANRMSTSIGHQHSGGSVLYAASFHDQIWGMNTGCLIDKDAYAFGYGKAMRKKPTLGIGLILDNMPVFLPMLVDKNNRWIGSLPKI